jgi:hypothetical protein
MDSPSLRTPYWRAASPKARPARPARLKAFKSMVLFVTEQVLQFWPPYRVEECDCCKPDVPEGDQDEQQS